MKLDFQFSMAGLRFAGTGRRREPAFNERISQTEN